SSSRSPGARIAAHVLWIGGGNVSVGPPPSVGIRVSDALISAGYGPVEDGLPWSALSSAMAVPSLSIEWDRAPGACRMCWLKPLNHLIPVAIHRPRAGYEQNA